MPAIFLPFASVKPGAVSRGDSRAASEIEHRRLGGAARFQSRHDDHIQVDRPSGTRHPILKDRQLPAQELFIDARQLARLQRPAIRESFPRRFRLVAGPAANREKQERTGDRRKSRHRATLATADKGNNYKASDG